MLSGVLRCSCGWKEVSITADGVRNLIDVAEEHARKGTGHSVHMQAFWSSGEVPAKAKEPA